MAERMFPIQADFIGEERRIPSERLPAHQVPWKVAERAYDVYSHIFGTDQSLERLAERGGFGWIELTVFLVARRWPKKEWKAVTDSLFEARLEVTSA